jgi:hypothetical protein
MEQGVISAKLSDHSRPQFHLSQLGGARVDEDVKASGGESGNV